MSDILEARDRLVARILGRDGQVPRSQRLAAFENAGLEAPLAAFVDKVATRPREITDADIEVLGAAGLSEDQLFELAVCSAVGQANRQYERALRALDAATQDEH